MPSTKEKNGLYLQDLDQNAIRLLHLQPGTFGMPIQCRLVSAPLDSPGDYQALSYTWGDSSITTPIKVNDESLDITRSLESALRHLRNEHEELTLWVDAICINQKSISERDYQVQIMKEIYKLARSVLVWLGEGNSQTDWIMDRFQDLKTNEERDEFIDLEFIEAFQTIMKFPWWERKWTIQEFAVAESYPRFGCGFKWVPWPSIFYAGVCTEGIARAFSVLTSFDQEGTWAAHWNNRARQLSRIRLRHGDFGFNLHKALRMTRRYATSDPRDAVFSLLGLVHPDYGVLLDYSQKPRQIFINTVKLIIEKDRSLNILSFETPRDTKLNLPSWVPDFSSHLPKDWPRSIDYRNELNTEYYASGFLQGPEILSPLTPDTLNVRGVKIDKIGMTSVKDFPHDPQTLFKIFRFMEEEVNNCIENGIYQDLNRRKDAYDLEGKSTWDSFFRILTMWSRPIGAELVDRAAALLSDLARARKNEPLIIDSQRVEYIMPAMVNAAQVFRKRSFLTTSTLGLVGIGPRQMEEGDWLVVLLGATVPFVLRAADDGCFKVVGECYVHGIMKGELMGVLESYEAHGISLTEFVLI